MQSKDEPTKHTMGIRKMDSVDYHSASHNNGFGLIAKNPAHSSSFNGLTLSQSIQKNSFLQHPLIHALEQKQRQSSVGIKRNNEDSSETWRPAGITSGSGQPLLAEKKENQLSAQREIPVSSKPPLQLKSRDTPKHKVQKQLPGNIETVKTEGSVPNHPSAPVQKSVNYQITCSLDKSKGVVQAFGICTTQGIAKNYNEDGVSIIMNVTRDQKDVVKNDHSSNYSYFSVFDGHGGQQCVSYLRDNLHLKILNDPEFPKSCDKAIFNGIIKAEKEFLQSAHSPELVENSGACCLVALFKSK